jgi:hypothetical protein
MLEIYGFCVKLIDQTFMIHNNNLDCKMLSVLKYADYDL